jgi:hypothetical protein
MKANDYKIIVGLYLRGDDLDPTLITKKLGINPSRSQYKGEKKTTSTEQEYVAKIGMWAVIEESDTSDTSILSAHINSLASKVKMGGTIANGLDGVQEAYIDVFIAKDSDEDGEGTCEFELSKEDFTALKHSGLPVRFTVSIVKR